MMAHEILGHPGRNKLNNTIKQLGWNVKEKQEDDECAACKIGKAMRKRMKKESEDKSNKPGERIMIDISSVKAKKQKKQKNLVVGH